MRELFKINSIIKLRHNGASYFYSLKAEDKVKKYLQSKDVINFVERQTNKRNFYKLLNQNLIIKTNSLSGFKRRILAHYSLQNKYGKFSLVDEYKILSRLNNISFVPKVYAYACNRYGLLKKEKLLIEYFPNSLSLSEYVERYPNKIKESLLLTFELFEMAWKSAFAHMDPNPGNILFTSEGLKFIDFESCCLSLPEKGFYYGFCLGYLYHYWIKKYITDSEYDLVVKEFTNSLPSTINSDLFYRYYTHFKYNKVSRRLRYHCFHNEDVRLSLIDSELKIESTA
ncbi:lipopolysaccharide kinase InaA family protein [Thiopseudomonas alkaliphila]|uniref:lipopolysaccharide kinase InaA family protein n=1 Tax=Thiopseudomonas alkaliphila TaxID=1697053 RepID=UPI00357112AC